MTKTVEESLMDEQRKNRGRKDSGIDEEGENSAEKAGRRGM